jgi:hypothetical protein
LRQGGKNEKEKYKKGQVQMESVGRMKNNIGFFIDDL